MRRRLDLAVSLITSPPIVFLDEPTTGLDPVTRGEMWDVIRNLVQSGSTVVLTTQYLEEADQLADRIAVINHGEVVAEGTPEKLKSLIGDTYFEITAANAKDSVRAQNIVTDMTGMEVLSLPERAAFAVKMSDTTEMISVLESLRNKNIDVKEFTVRKPTLDEVFIELTKGGH
jgi:ABC-2 type transport system ATP-binding protein